MIDIAFSSDQAFVPNLLVASASAVYACRGGGDEVAVHVLDCGIGDAAWSEYIGKMQKLAQSCGVTTHVLRHAIDMQLFANVKAWTNGSRATWARLLLPRILLDVHCCVYSDCDVLFIENPAGILDELKASGRAILGHRNPFGNHSPDGAWFRGQKLPFDADSYFCAGLVGVNLDMMRKAGTDDACWEFLQKFPNPVSVDQTVLNYVCRDSKGILSDGWGLFTHECYVAASPIKAIHFSGGWPWAIARNVYDALCILLADRAVTLWYLFQTDVLGVGKSRRPKPRAFYRVGAFVVLWICRILKRSCLVPARFYCITELVASFDGKSSALDDTRKRILQRI